MTVVAPVILLARTLRFPASRDFACGLPLSREAGSLPRHAGAGTPTKQLNPRLERGISAEGSRFAHAF